MLQRIRNYIKVIIENRDYIYRKCAVSNYPKVIGLELNNCCNFRCSFCPPFTRKKGFMSRELLRTILEDIAPTQKELVQLHYHGESLMHPEFDEMMRMCKEYGLTIGLSTNCSLLDEDKSKRLIESGLDYLTLAFDGVSKEIYEANRKGGNFERVRDNILRFLEIRDELNSATPYTDLHVIKLDESLPLLGKFREFWQKTNVDQITFKSYSTRGGQVNESLADSKNWYYGQRKTRYPCSWFWSSVIILWDGRVVPCCHDMEGKIILGDLKKNTMSEIWNGERIVQLREREIAGDYNKDLCLKCNEWVGKPKGVPAYVWDTMKRRITLFLHGQKDKGIFEVVYRRK